MSYYYGCSQTELGIKHWSTVLLPKSEATQSDFLIFQSFLGITARIVGNMPTKIKKCGYFYRQLGSNAQSDLIATKMWLNCYEFLTGNGVDID